MATPQPGSGETPQRPHASPQAGKAGREIRSGELPTNYYHRIDKRSSRLAADRGWPEDATDDRPQPGHLEPPNEILPVNRH